VSATRRRERGNNGGMPRSREGGSKGPFLLAPWLLFAFLERRMRLDPALVLGRCATWALGSLALPFSMVFFGHQTAAAFLIIGFCPSALELDRDGGPRSSRSRR
jgi:hypothetical protein